MLNQPNFERGATSLCLKSNVLIINNYLNKDQKTSVAQRLFLSSRRSFVLLGMVTFLSFGLMPNALHADGYLNCPTSSHFTGGFVVIMSGLVSQPVILEFNGQKTSGKYAAKNDPIKMSILADDGSLAHELITDNQSIDFTNLVLPSGNYTLVVQVGIDFKTVDFSRS